MDYKTLLIHVAPGAGDSPHVRAAVQIARLFDAQLTAVCTETFAPSDDPRLLHLDGLQLKPLREAIERQAMAARAQFEVLAEGLSTQWRTALEDPDDTLVRHAAGADLIVAERPLPRQDPRRFAEADDLVLESGLPVLVTPPRQADIDFRRVVVAWKATREANRAIADALPILKRAESVSIVAECSESRLSATQAELDDVAARLARHGAPAETFVRQASQAPAAEVILEFAAAHRAGLIVAGGYAHSRLRQWIFGGVTRQLLEMAWTPVLFSH